MSINSRGDKNLLICKLKLILQEKFRCYALTEAAVMSFTVIFFAASFVYNFQTQYIFFPFFFGLVRIFFFCFGLVR